MGWRRLTIVMLVVVECALLLVIIPFPSSLREREGRKLLTLPADEARKYIEQLDELPAEFIPPLVALMDHEDLTLADVSRRRLVNALQTWREDPVATAQSHVAVLARSLNSRAAEFRRNGKRHAARVAEAILNWPLPPDADAVPVIDDARQVLALRPQVGTLPLVDVSTDSNPDPLLAPLDSMARFPGGGVPVEPEELPSEKRKLPPGRSNSTSWRTSFVE